MSHRPALPHLSPACNLRCPVAATLSLCVYLWYPSFFLSFCLSLSLFRPMSHLSCPSFCLSNHLLLSTEAFSFSTSYLAQQSFKCNSQNLAAMFFLSTFPFLIWCYPFHASHHSASDELLKGAVFQRRSLSRCQSTLPPFLSFMVSQWTFAVVILRCRGKTLTEGE